MIFGAPRFSRSNFASDLSASLIICLILMPLARAVEHPTTPVPADRDGAWPMVGRDFAESRFSPLRDIDDVNVQRLGLVWYYDLDTHRGQEATPIVIDGTMYTSSAWSKVQAFDAASGQLRWQYDPDVPGHMAVHACCDVVNRGVAVASGRVFLGTLDGRLIALDARRGSLLWSVATTNSAQPYSITGAPLVVHGEVIIGSGGAEYGVRGYVSAYNAATGKRLWRFYTVPGNPAKGFEEPALAAAAKTWSGRWWNGGGGGTVWNSISYDPDLDLIYFGTGNPFPWARPAANDTNLFTSSIVALHASTGRYAWHYQTTPGDQWDYDAAQTLNLATLTLDGRPRNVIIQANKNGYLYVLDRRTGELLSARNYVPVTWAKEIDPKSGKPNIDPDAKYVSTGKAWFAMPGSYGAHNWQPSSFSPLTGLLYIPAQELPFPFIRDPDFKSSTLSVNLGIDLAAVSLPQDPRSKAAAYAGLKGYLSAWDPVGQREVWRAQYLGPWNGGVLSTAGNLVFQGTAAGEFIAYRASDGQKLWSQPVQTGVIAAPMTFKLGEIQYVTIIVGWGGGYPLVAGELAFKSGFVVNRSRVLTYAIDGTNALPALPPAEYPPSRQYPLTSKNTGLSDEAALGAALYARFCSGCHGDAAVSGGPVPDLRLSNVVRSEDAFTAVVNEGVLDAKGMVSFKSALSSTEQQAIRIFILNRARQTGVSEASPEIPISR